MHSMMDKSEAQFRMQVAGLSVIATVVVLFLFHLLLPDNPEAKINLSDLVIDKTFFSYPFTVQNIMWFFFFITVGEIWVRFNRASREAEIQRMSFISAEDNVLLRSKDLIPVYRKLKENNHLKDYFIPRLLNKGIIQFQKSQSIEQVNTIVNSSLDLMQHELDLKYNMIRYLVWLIPTIGFLGTVLGIAFALSETAAMPDVAMGEDIRPWLQLVTSKLGIAFYTTLIALFMSAILVFFMHIAQGREETALNYAGQYCIDRLVNKLIAGDSEE